MSVSLSHPARPRRFDPVAAERPPGNRDRAVQAVLRTSLSGLVGREVVALFQDRWQRLAASAVRGDLGRQLDERSSALTTILFRDYAERWLADRKVKGRAAGGADPSATTGPPRPVHPRHVRHASRSTRSPATRWSAGTTGPPSTARRTGHGRIACCGRSSPRRSTTATSVNPARIRGAGQVERRHKVRPATLGELSADRAMPPRYRLMVQLAAWCALRFGELTELRRGDVDTAGVLRIRRAVVWSTAGSWSRSRSPTPACATWTSRRPAAAGAGAPARPHRARAGRAAVPREERPDRSPAASALAGSTTRPGRRPDGRT